MFEDPRFATAQSFLTSSEIRQLDGEGRQVLVLLLESVQPVQDVLITHELGHHIVKLQNYCMARPLNRVHTDTAACLNSLSQHPAIYAMQRQHRQDPGSDIDNRARLRASELVARGRQIVSPLIPGLQLADDLMHASEPIAAELGRLASDRAPAAWQVAETVREVAGHYELADLEQHEQFLRHAVDVLNLGIDWIFGSEVPLLRADLANAERRRKRQQHSR